MSALLAVEGLSKRFGGLQANHHISFEVREGDLVGVIGPNGAGKTTLFEQISGFLKPDAGTVSFDGRDITGVRPDRVCSAGIGRTFQIVRVFPELTVLQNVMIGAFRQHRRAEEARAAAARSIERVGLGDRGDALAHELTLAARKRVELARALATGPRLLLLDEVMAGLNKSESQEAMDLLRSLREEVTIVMIEHVMEIVMPLSDRVVVLVEGRKLLEGSPDEVSRHPEVIAAYLGEGFRARGA